MMFLWIIIVVALVLWFSGAFGKRSGWGTIFSTHTDALEILQQRYARGEINRAEFETRRQDIMDHATD